MNCKNHPDKRAMAVCEKFGVGFCDTCCEQEEIDDDHPYCYCSSPKVHCKFRPQCIIYFKARKKSRERKEGD